MTETMLSKKWFPLSSTPFQTAARRAALPARMQTGKEFRSSRKKIVDSAPLCVYVQVNLPNCEQTGAAASQAARRNSMSVAWMQSSPMTPSGQDRRRKAQRLYEHEQWSAAAIAKECGVTPGTIARWARADQWSRAPGEASEGNAPIDRRALVARAWRNAERQLRAVEKRLRAHGAEDGPLDESARLIATLVKTLRELAALDRTLAEEGGMHGKQTAEPGSGEIPRDLDAFYEELAKRMDRLRQHRDGHGIAERPAATID